MNILAIGAHPDDVEIFCAGTLLKYRRQGHRVLLALTTSGNVGSDIIEGRERIAATREAEQLAAGRCSMPFAGPTPRWSSPITRAT
jgi:LmbE family N-acetylglucosaminyl deacetylase